ncbi:MAG: TraB/GumN family protein [Flavobacterium sp.]|nr:TraB/GumN family protein [Flavobacterium sp.]
MKKIFISLLTLISGFSFSQELEKSLLWRISGNGLQQESYLFGTIHMTCDATLEKNTIKALENTKQLYLELDMDDESMQKQMMKHMIMKDDKKLSSLLSAEDFKLVDEFLKKNIKMSAKMFDSFKPFIVTTMLYPKMLDCPFQSVENTLMKISKEQNEEIFGLETVEEQMRVFDKIPYEIQAEELVKMAKSDLAKDKAEMNKMMKIYQNKDIEGMLKMMEESDNKISAENQEVLLNNRNKNWIPLMIEIMSDKPTFFGVGAAHLAGEEGVINLLRKKGYEVEAVK